MFNWAPNSGMETSPPRRSSDVALGGDGLGAVVRLECVEVHAHPAEFVEPDENGMTSRATEGVAFLFSPDSPNTWGCSSKTFEGMPRVRQLWTRCTPPRCLS